MKAGPLYWVVHTKAQSSGNGKQVVEPSSPPEGVRAEPSCSVALCGGRVSFTAIGEVVNP